MLDPPLEPDLVSKAKMEMLVYEYNVSQVSWTNKPTVIIRSREQTAFKEVISSVIGAGTEITIVYRRGGMHLISLAVST